MCRWECQGLAMVNFAMEVVIQRANNPMGRDFDLVSADVDYRKAPPRRKSIAHHWNKVSRYAQNNMPRLLS